MKSTADAMDTALIWAASYWTPRGVRLYWIGHIFTIILCILVTLQINTLFKLKQDIIKFINCLGVLILCGMSLVKWTYFRIFDTKWRNLLKNVVDLEIQQEMDTIDKTSDEDYYSDGNEGENHNKEVISSKTNKYKRQLDRIAKLILVVYMFPTITYVVAPYIEYVVRLFLGQVPDLPRQMFGLWSPFPEDSLLGYFIIFIIETIGPTYAVFSYCAFDTFNIGVMMFITAQFSLLKEKCVNIAGAAAILKESENMNSRKRDARAHYRIMKCQQHHLVIVKLTKKLNTLLWPIMGLDFFLAALKLCLLSVELSQLNKMTIKEVYGTMQYMGGAMAQIFFFCWFGDQVFSESGSFSSQGGGVFGSAWWALSPHVRREVSLLSMGLKEPIPLRAGLYVHTLTLPTFVTIVRIAYSGYAILSQQS